MDLSFERGVADAYQSVPQKIRNLSEHWVARELYCPSCGKFPIDRYGHNQPVADFFCSSCGEDYELKSQAKVFGPRVVDGAYGTMIGRLVSATNPNLLLLQYNKVTLSVSNLLVIPKYFFVPEMIEKRNALSPTARRAGWIGCNILPTEVPEAGRISLIKGQAIIEKSDVLADWRRVLFLREQRNLTAKEWLLIVMKCIERLQKDVFTLDELYGFEPELTASHPSNRHIKDKIRQKLQVLRDKGYLDFVAKGRYQLRQPAPKIDLLVR